MYGACTTCRKLCSTPVCSVCCLLPSALVKAAHYNTTTSLDTLVFHCCCWCHQTSTVHKQGHLLLPKDYTFKVQLIRESSSRVFSEQQRRKTIARTKLNMAEFCSNIATPAASEVVVPLHPRGSLKLTIRAVWLQHDERQGDSKGGSGDADSVTDCGSVASGDSFGSSSSGRGECFGPAGIVGRQRRTAEE